MSNTHEISTPEAINLTELQATLDAATPGPWRHSYRAGEDGGYRTQVYPAADEDNSIATLHWHSVRTSTGWMTDREPNAALIAMAPDLAALVADLTAERDALADAVDANWVTHQRVVAAEATVADLTAANAALAADNARLVKRVDEALDVMTRICDQNRRYGVILGAGNNGAQVWHDGPFATIARAWLAGGAE